jgi:hypothetical protein
VTYPTGIDCGVGELSEKNGRGGEAKEDVDFELWFRHYSSLRRPIENPLLMSEFNTVHSGASELTSRFNP